MAYTAQQRTLGECNSGVTSFWCLLQVELGIGARDSLCSLHETSLIVCINSEGLLYLGCCLHVGDEQLLVRLILERYVPWACYWELALSQ